jgi:hypothetical protein
MRNISRAMHNLKTKRLGQWIAAMLAVGMVLAPFCSACCWISVHPAVSNAATEEVSCHHHTSTAGSYAWNHFEGMQHCDSADAAVEPSSSQNSFSLSPAPLFGHSAIFRALIAPARNVEIHLSWSLGLSPQTQTDIVVLNSLRV